MNQIHQAFSYRNIWRTMLCGFSLSLVSSSIYAISPTSLSQSPLFLVTSAEPLVMLNLSNDHELYYKAYDDFSNLDSSPEEETTYTHSVDYYGYFDAYKCYNYSSSIFVPVETTADKYCDSAGAEWSGNFLNWASMTRMDAIRKILYGGMRSTDTASETILERAFLPTDAHSFVKYYSDTTEIRRLTPFPTDISICNTTYASSGNSKDITAAPLMRIAQGNYSMWTAHEANQCHWFGESSNTNGNVPAITGIPASTTPPISGNTYEVRIKVCVPGLLDGTNCQNYPSGNSKPTGLLQEYGEDGLIQFGLITGSYQKNKSGGVLRKNVSSFADEINEDTDGTFSTAPAAGSIVDTLNKLRISRFDYGLNRYNELDSCTFAQFGFVDGQCSNWGNPQSEIYYESLRYFSGLAKTAAFDADDTGYINNLGKASWTDPLTSANYCAPVNIIQFNTSTTSFDGDQLGGFTDFPSSTSLDSFTNGVGTGEGITDSGNYFIGSIPTDTDKACTAKDLDNLSDASGTCPEAPWLEGTYHLAGLAHYAHTESIRSDLTEHDSSTTADIKVKNFGVALSPAQPVINIPVPDDPNGKELIILPACMEYRTDSPSNRHNGNCAIVDFKIVTPHTVVDGEGSGKFLVLWESAQFGGDYDQDMGGIIEYVIGPDVDTAHDGIEIQVTTDVYAASTGGIHGFGYIISGTTEDGLHIHSGHNSFQEYTDPHGAPDCTSASVGPCTSGQAATSRIFELGDASATQLEPPLYYAAKWGGFEEEADLDDRPTGTDAPNGTPDQTYEWDANNDGLPDTYFFSTNPAELVTSLSNVFLGISEQQASASSTAANSQRADVGSNIFQAQFSSEDWSGKLLKYLVDSFTGDLSLDSTWGTDGSGDAGDTLTAAGRTIITYNPDKTGPSDDGIGFTWSEMSTSQIALLNLDPISGATDSNGESRLNFIRGDRSLELQNGGSFRNRSRVLGDIINSAPVFAGDPSFLYSDILEVDTVETYSAFKTRVSSRNSMLYVGGNDGMLHGFDATTGLEKLAYIPGGVFGNLSKLTSLDYSHQYFVDGSPSVGDAVFSDNAWHTVILGGLNAGGQSIYALDVTDPSVFAENSASQTVLWEITPATVTDVDGNGDDVLGFSELGYTFSRPAIVKNHRDSDGGWIGIFGNGYAGASGHAVLYVVDLEYGTIISTLTVDGTGNNGLTTASPVDVNGDDKIDVIYAGDLKGNMWKFIPDTGNTWVSAFDGTPNCIPDCTPLFTTPADLSGYVQPITTRPEVGLHPTGLPGVMVYFGTGKYFENGDNLADSNVQRFYGIWDLWDKGDSSSLDSAPNSPPILMVSDGNLLQQCVTTGTTAETCVANAASTSGEVLQNYEVRFISSNTINVWSWDETLGKMGWYIDLPEHGEKQVTYSILRAGRIIFVTVVPSDHSCSDGGESWLMELDAADGSAMDIPVFDLNDDGSFDEDDMKGTDTDGDGDDDTYLIPGGKRSKEGIIQPPSILTNTDEGIEFKYSSGSTGNIEKTTENPAPFTKGRKSWVQLK